LKKLFLTIFLFSLILLVCSSAYAFESSMTNTYLIANTDGYTFETVIKPSCTAECMPIIAMYDETGILCGLMYGETISIEQNVPLVKTFKVNSEVQPSSIKLMLWKADGSFAPLCRFEQVPTEVYTENFGMITQANSSGTIQIFATDASHATYSVRDNVILSYKNTLVSDKTTALSYIDSLKFNYTQGDEPSYLWKIFKDGTDDDDLKQSLGNYTKRMIRFLTTDTNKIGLISFADDSLFNKLSSGAEYTEAFYNLPDKSFNDKFALNDGAKILYIPTKSSATENDYRLYSSDQLKNGNLYYAKSYTTSDGNQIILMTFMASDQELAAFNLKPITYINDALYGDDYYDGIKDKTFNIALYGQLQENNDKANIAANTAMRYVSAGLQDALNYAGSGYAITKTLIKTKCEDDINTAKAQIDILQEMDSSLSSGYYEELKQKIANTVSGTALKFLETYFLK